ncbi:MAG: serine hydrolase [Bacteroidetes bacterium GWF2_38_335]|nr:MAG: serine hydrolase [Bacteroidetes bacterium GWF2_38_335]OFY78036.1 MAG: serine hydrolase [Bacteroidetes bacterium RIFOXYA12_FULL_38_20]HBS88308.1 serine hydrolase [Bacteroidales bacterium]
MKYIITKAAILSVLISLILFSCTYLTKAIKYTNAGIDDYKIFDNRVIRAGEEQIWMNTIDYNTKEISSEKLDKFKEFETIAFLILENGSIKYEKYWMGYDENSLTNSFSAAKSIVALLVGIAIDEGKIKSVDQKVGEFIPEFSKGKNADLTIKDVLTMSSGLNWNESYGSPFSVTTKAYYGTNLDRLILKLKTIEEPGKVFKYLSGNTQLLAMILQKATGKNISDYASEKLWKPLGAKNDALWCLDEEEGMEKAYCCFNSNARDFARIGQLCLNKGKWGTKQIISEKYLEDALSSASYLVDEDGKKVDYYGYQWWIINYKGMDIPYARGILGQYIFVIPQKNAVVVRLGHKRSEERTGAHTNDAFLYLDAAFEILEKK